MTTERQPLPRTFIIIAFGPLVGAVVMSLVFIALAIIGSDGPLEWQGVVYGLMLYLAFGWVAGLLPAIAAALIWRLAVPAGWSLRRRVIAAILIGGATSAVLVWPFVSVFLSFMPVNPSFAGLSAFCGAVALCATALPGGNR